MQAGNGNVKTVLIGTNVQIINNDIQQNEFTGEDLRRIIPQKVIF